MQKVSVNECRCLFVAHLLDFREIRIIRGHQVKRSFLFGIDVFTGGLSRFGFVGIFFARQVGDGSGHRVHQLFFFSFSTLHVHYSLTTVHR